MNYDVILIGSGFGALSAAALLAKRGLKVCVMEQAKYPGGCATSYKHKGNWFETGATTLVGLDEGMPLRYLLDELGVEIPLRKLEVPMQVHLPNGERITRYGNLEEWIAEAERVFGKYKQREFWEHCHRISRQVWRTSLKQRSFPFSSLSDVLLGVTRARPSQLSLLPSAFRTMQDVLQKYGLHQNRLFTDFVNEQLLITAQNHAHEVNELFGATALCYTLYSNYYVDGGLINLVKPIVSYLSENGGEVKYGHDVTQVHTLQNGYQVITSKGEYSSRFVISGIPLNNTKQLFSDASIKKRLEPYLLTSEKLNGAFTMSLVFDKAEAPACLHHQVHVPEGLPHIGSKSVFISFSHPLDKLRSKAGEQVASVSTHVPNPSSLYIQNKEQIETAILEALENAGLLKKENIKYKLAATPGAWIFWTKRAYGAVGGYPQYKSIKPWQMKDARLDHKGAYVCGDTVYPGQGIVGVCLSGIIAADKLWQDHF